LSAPSGVVTHTCADTGAGPLGSAAKAPTAAKVVALAAAIAMPSEAAMNLMRDIVVLSLWNQPCGTSPVEPALWNQHCGTSTVEPALWNQPDVM
jgi:hypothetical protein